MTKRSRRYLLRKKKGIVWQYIDCRVWKNVGGGYEMSMKDPKGIRVSIWSPTGYEEYKGTDKYGCSIWQACPKPTEREITIRKINQQQDEQT